MSCAFTPRSIAAREAIERADLLVRLKTFELATPTWTPSAGFHIHGPSSLPIRFTT